MIARIASLSDPFSVGHFSATRRSSRKSGDECGDNGSPKSLRLSGDAVGSIPTAGAISIASASSGWGFLLHGLIVWKSDSVPRGRKCLEDRVEIGIQLVVLSGHTVRQSGGGVEPHPAQSGSWEVVPDCANSDPPLFAFKIEPAGEAYRSSPWQHFESFFYRFLRCAELSVVCLPHRQ